MHRGITLFGNSTEKGSHVMANFKAEPGTIVRFPAGHTLAETEGVIVGIANGVLDSVGWPAYEIKLETIHDGRLTWWAYRHEFRCIGREEKQD